MGSVKEVEWLWMMKHVAKQGDDCSQISLLPPSHFLLLQIGLAELGKGKYHQCIGVSFFSF